MLKPEFRLINLDVLRLISAVMVIGAHYGFRMHITGEGGTVSFPEFAGVSVWFEAAVFVFFMISGYVISLSAAGRTGYQFFAGRLARVLPTFFFCATVTALVMHYWEVPGQAAPTIKQWLAHIVIASRLFGQPMLDGAYWTIVYELVFYMWVFLLLSARLFETRWKEVILVWLAISAINEVFVGSAFVERMLITKYSGCFLFGWALYRNQAKFTLSGFAVMGLAAIWAVATPVMVEPQITQFYGIVRDVPVLVALGVAAVLVTIAAVLAPSLPFNATLVAMLAGMTYPIYLLHQNIGYAIFNRFGADLGRWLTLCVVLSFILSMAWFVATYVEPFCRVRLQKLLLKRKKPLAPQLVLREHAAG